ncbi:hypothetical protein GW17_00059558 [Ensete ventricosum]|nr:hypothetical protein GW17_00059558 [Ensete ventricosum]
MASLLLLLCYTDEICNSSGECGKGSCQVSTDDSIGYVCKCNLWWSQFHTRDYFRFLPCIIPNCNVDVVNRCMRFVREVVCRGRSDLRACKNRVAILISLKSLQKLAHIPIVERALVLACQPLGIAVSAERVSLITGL